MKILIAGAGKVGASLTRGLSADGHEITLIDLQKAALESLCEQYDAMGLEGNCASMRVLSDAGVTGADLLIAVTDADELNLLSCVTARKLNPNLRTIARIRNPEYTEQVYAMRDLFGLSMIINPERAAAREIEHVLRYPGFLQRDAFARGRVQIVEFRLEKDSRLCGVALKDIAPIVKCRILICVVQRDGQAIMPKGDFVLQEGDRIFATAPANNLSILLRQLKLVKHKVHRVILCGGGRISYYLAQQLEKNGIETQIIELSPRRCEELAKVLPHTSIIHGDVSDPELLEKEGLANCDALAALTGLDELNILISLYAKSKKVPYVITKQSHNDHMSALVETLPLDTLISPKDLSSESILSYVRSLRDTSGQTAITVQAIAGGQAEASEFIIRKESLHQGEPLAQLKIRPGVLIAAISRGTNIEIPSGGSMYQEGDTVIVIASSENPVYRFNDIFA